jgi:hypothetical protein
MDKQNTNNDAGSGYIGLAMIVIIIIGGAMYLIGNNKKTQNTPPKEITEQAVVEKLELSTSEEITEIEADLEKLSDFENLEQELNSTE